MSNEKSKTTINEQTVPSDLMEPVEGIRKTTMEEDFSELYGEEINALRGISRKVFDLGKGRRQAISYSEPVHYVCAGKYEEIDNRLEYDEKENVLRTKANAYSTTIAKTDEGKAIVTMERDGQAFPLRYKGESRGAFRTRNQRGQAAFRNRRGEGFADR